MRGLAMSFIHYGNIAKIASLSLSFLFSKVDPIQILYNPLNYGNILSVVSGT